jgi:hypothetical protein
MFTLTGTSRPWLFQVAIWLQGRGNHPVADLQADGMVVHRGQKSRRGQQTPLRMLPADQGLCTDHLAGAHVDLGLVVQDKLVRCQRLVQARHFLALRFDGRVAFHIEQVVAVLARLFGLVHGLVGMADEQVGSHAIGRKQRHTNACRKLEQPVAQAHRVGCGAQHAVQHGMAVVQMLQVRQHGDEFVAPHAREGIALAQGRLQALCQGHEQIVALLMAMQVVDGLETVQVDERHRQAMAFALAARHGLLQAVGQQHAVGQAGQGVVVCDAFEFAFVFLDGSDVGEQRHIVRGGAQRVAHRADGDDFGKQLAVLAAVPHLAGPVARVPAGSRHMVGIEGSGPWRPELQACAGCLTQRPLRACSR